MAHRSNFVSSCTGLGGKSSNSRGNMDGTPEIKFWMKFRMKYWMTGFETFDFFAWFFQYLDIQFQAHAEK